MQEVSSYYQRKLNRYISVSSTKPSIFDQLAQFKDTQKSFICTDIRWSYNSQRKCHDVTMLRSTMIYEETVNFQMPQEEYLSLEELTTDKIGTVINLSEVFAWNFITPLIIQTVNYIIFKFNIQSPSTSQL